VSRAKRRVARYSLLLPCHGGGCTPFRPVCGFRPILDWRLSLTPLGFASRERARGGFSFILWKLNKVTGEPLFKRSVSRFFHCCSCRLGSTTPCSSRFVFEYSLLHSPTDSATSCKILLRCDVLLGGVILSFRVAGLVLGAVGLLLHVRIL